MLAKITVADYMTKRLISLSKEDDVIHAIKKMLDHKITSAPVLDKEGRLIGMFSEKDGMRVFLESVYDQGVSGKVGDFMTTDVLSVEAQSSIVDAAEKFQALPVRSFPVYDRGKLAGIISRVDVLRALASQ